MVVVIFVVLLAVVTVVMIEVVIVMMVKILTVILSCLPAALARLRTCLGLRHR